MSNPRSGLRIIITRRYAVPRHQIVQVYFIFCLVYVNFLIRQVLDKLHNMQNIIYKMNNYTSFMQFLLQKNRSKLLVREDVKCNFGTHLYYCLFFSTLPKITYHQKFLYTKNCPFRSPIPFVSFNSYKDVFILIIYYYILSRARN